MGGVGALHSIEELGEARAFDDPKEKRERQDRGTEKGKDAGNIGSRSSLNETFADSAIVQKCAPNGVDHTSPPHRHGVHERSV